MATQVIRPVASWCPMCRAKRRGVLLPERITNQLDELYSDPTVVAEAKDLPRRMLRALPRAATEAFARQK